MGIVVQEVKAAPRPQSVLAQLESEKVQFGFRSRGTQHNAIRVARRNTWGNLEDVYNRLCMVVEYHRYLFYIENAPKVPDHEYDAMRSELEDFEKMYPHMKAEWSPIFKGASDDPEDYSPSLRHLVKVGVNIARRPAYEWCSL